MASTAADFLGKTQPRIAPIRGLEQWGLIAFMRSMTAREKIDFEASVLNDDHTAVEDARLKTVKARLVISQACDESGKPLFDEKQLAQVQEIDSKLLEVMYSQINQHVGFDRGDVEKLVKNSKAGPA